MVIIIYIIGEKKAMKRTFKLTQFKTFFKVRYFFFYKCVDNIDIKAF